MSCLSLTAKECWDILDSDDIVHEESNTYKRGFMKDFIFKRNNRYYKLSVYGTYDDGYQFLETCNMACPVEPVEVKTIRWTECK